MFRRGNGETILVVEDESAILAMITSILERTGYAVLAANTPGDAICLANKHIDEMQLLITDLVMPGMNGSDLCRKIMFMSPSMKCLFMSGHTFDILNQNGIFDTCFDNFIQKPFSIVDFLEKIQQVLSSN